MAAIHRALATPGDIAIMAPRDSQIPAVIQDILAHAGPPVAELDLNHFTDSDRARAVKLAPFYGLDFRATSDPQNVEDIYASVPTNQEALRTRIATAKGGVLLVIGTGQTSYFPPVPRAVELGDELKRLRTIHGEPVPPDVRIVLLRFVPNGDGRLAVETFPPPTPIAP